MRTKELERGIAGHTYDRTNPEALRVRRGKVGGYKDYLTTDDERVISDSIVRTGNASQRIIALTGYTLG